MAHLLSKSSITTTRLPLMAMCPVRSDGRGQCHARPGSRHDGAAATRGQSKDDVGRLCL